MCEKYYLDTHFRWKCDVGCSRFTKWVCGKKLSWLILSGAVRLPIQLQSPLRIGNGGRGMLHVGEQGITRASSGNNAGWMWDWLWFCSTVMKNYGYPAGRGCNQQGEIRVCRASDPHGKLCIT